MSKRCAQCATDNPDDATFCRACSEPLTDAPADASDRRCAECGHVNPPGVRYCERCHENLLGSLIMRHAALQRTAPSPPAAPSAHDVWPPLPTSLLDPAIFAPAPAPTTTPSTPAGRPMPPAPPVTSPAVARNVLPPPQIPSPPPSEPLPSTLEPLPQTPEPPPPAPSRPLATPLVTPPPPAPAPVRVAPRSTAVAAARLRRTLWVVLGIAAASAAGFGTWLSTRPHDLAASNVELPAPLPPAASAIATDAASAPVAEAPAASTPIGEAAAASVAPGAVSEPQPASAAPAPQAETAAAPRKPTPDPRQRDKVARERAEREARAASTAAAERAEAARRQADAQPPTRDRAEEPGVAPPVAAAPPRPSTVDEECAGRSGIGLGVCQQRLCLSASHAAEATCQRVRDADARHRGDFPP